MKETIHLKVSKEDKQTIKDLAKSKRMTMNSYINKVRLFIMGRKLGVPNKITAEVKEKLANILDEAIDSIDIKTMTKAERLKLIQISIQYVIPRLKQVEEITEEEPRSFQIEIIDSLSKYSNDEIDKAITK